MTTLRILNGGMLGNILGDLVAPSKLQKGDAVLTCETKEEVAVGRAAFERLLTQGYTAIELDKNNKTLGSVQGFKEDAETIILFGPVAGG